VLVEGFDGWVLVIDLRARFIHVLVKIRPEEGREMLGNVEKGLDFLKFI
jgi:hypothetical protein